MTTSDRNRVGQRIGGASAPLAGARTRRTFPVQPGGRKTAQTEFVICDNTIERLNREIKRRTDVVQVFPDDDAALRLAGAILLKTSEEWAADERHYFS